MSLPATDRANPRELATGATVSARFHDVVVAVTKAIHEAPLNSGDKEDLRWAKDLLSSAGTKRTVVTMPSAHELSNQANPVLFIKRAAGPAAGEDPELGLRKMSKNLDAVLRGQRNEELAESLHAVRTIFSMVSQMTLGANVSRNSEHSPVREWPDLTTTSSS
jgi:hypothetical protein